MVVNVEIEHYEAVTKDEDEDSYSDYVLQSNDNI